MYIYHASLFFSHNVFVLWSEIAREIKRNQTTVTATVEILNRQLNARWTIDRVYFGYIVFAERKHQKIINIEVMMLMNVIGNQVNKHAVISLHFPCLIASLLSCLLMSSFLFVWWLGFV